MEPILTAAMDEVQTLPEARYVLIERFRRLDPTQADALLTMYFPAGADPGLAELALIPLEGPTMANMGFMVQRCDWGASEGISLSGKVPDDVLPHALRPDFMRIRREAGNDYGPA